MAVVFLRTMYPYSTVGAQPPPGIRRRSEISGYWGSFEQLLRECLAELGHLVVEQSAHPMVPDDSAGAELRIVAHRTRRDGPGDLFYKQMHLPTLFTIDTWGWGADHSGLHEPPDLDRIDQLEADRFVRHLYKTYVDTGRSKLSQPPRGNGECLPDDYIFLPMQMPGDYVLRHHSPVSALDFVVTTCRWAETVGQNLVVKLHPGLDGAFPEQREAVLRLVRTCRYVTCSEANIHDLIARSVGVFTVNSGVGFEGLIHGKPVVTFGNCDYKWATFWGRTDALDQARGSFLTDGPEQRRRAARFVFFYCRRHGFSTEPEDLPDSRRRLLAYLASQ